MYQPDDYLDSMIFAVHSDPGRETASFLREAGEEYDEEHQGAPVTPAVAAWWGWRTSRMRGFKWAPGMRVLDGYGEVYRVVEVQRGKPIVVTDARNASAALPLYAWLDLRDPETRRLAALSVGRVPDPGPVEPWVCRAASGWEKAEPPR